MLTVPTDVAAASQADLGKPLQPPQRLRLAVGVATSGRPAVLAKMLRRLDAQTRKPDAILVCAPLPSDVEGVAGLDPSPRFLIGPCGLPHQRNAILQDAREFDVVVFFDDDFVPSATYLDGVERVMLHHPEVVMTTGQVVEDGISGPGLDFETADSALNQTGSCISDNLVDVGNGYGCNMSVRVSTVRSHGLAFDERLPLYGWLEDVDFGQQLSHFGRVVKTDATRGVHLGVKRGRQPGLKLGYSQIANPLYLMRKGTMRLGHGVALMARNILMNALRSLRPEPWVDRRGRLAGNARAFADLVMGRLDPQRILSF